MKKYKTYHILTLLLAAMMAVSCSTTKHLPEGETLYLGLKKVTINNEDKSKAGQKALAEAEGAISIAPNNAIVVKPNIRFRYLSDYGYTIALKGMKKASESGYSKTGCQTGICFYRKS